MTREHISRIPDNSPFTLDEVGADGVGGFVPYGLELQVETLGETVTHAFVDTSGSRYSPDAIANAWHNDQILQDEDRHTDRGSLQ